MPFDPFPIAFGRAPKRKRDSEESDKDRNIFSRRKASEGTIVIDDDDPVHYRGQGTARDPMTLTEVVTGNLIKDEDAGMTVCISDSEYDEASGNLLDRRRRFVGQTISQRSRQGPAHGDNRAQLGNEDEALPLRRPVFGPNNQTERHRDTLGAPSNVRDRDKFNGKNTPSADDCALAAYRMKGDQLIPSRYENPEKAPEKETAISTREADRRPYPSWLFPRPSEASDEQSLTPYGAGQRNQVEGAELPGLTHSQDTVTSSLLDTPFSSQELGLVKPPANGRIDRAEDLKNRKRLLFRTYAKTLQPQLQRRLNKCYQFVDTADPEKCWLYKGPGLYKGRNRIELALQFYHEGKQKKLKINAALLPMIVENRLGNDDIEGIIEHAYHTSHLCGNFTCLNPNHITIEPGAVNSRRNRCFNYKYGPCGHTPPCLKHLKIELDLLRPVEKTRKPQELHGNGSDFYSMTPESEGTAALWANMNVSFAKR